MNVRHALLAPLRRDGKSDFAHGGGGELLVSKVLQVLATEGDTPRTSGELPWRTAFGSALHLLRHRNATAVVRELARIYTRDALGRWLPEVHIVDCTLAVDGSALHVHVTVTDDERPGAVSSATTTVSERS